MNELTTILICMVSAGTPIIYALLGDLIGQRTGITRLIVERSMLCGACVGFAVAAGSGSLFLAVLEDRSSASALESRFPSPFRF